MIVHSRPAPADALSVTSAETKCANSAIVMAECLARVAEIAQRAPEPIKGALMAELDDLTRKLALAIA